MLSAITGQPEAEFDENAVEFLIECVWTDESTSMAKAPRSPSRLPIMHTPQTSITALKRASKARSRVDKEILDQMTKVCHICLSHN